MDGIFRFYCTNLKGDAYFKPTSFFWRKDGRPGRLLFSRVDENGKIIEADCYYQKGTLKGLKMYHI